MGVGREERKKVIAPVKWGDACDVKEKKIQLPWLFYRNFGIIVWETWQGSSISLSSGKQVDVMCLFLLSAVIQVFLAHSVSQLPSSRWRQQQLQQQEQESGVTLMRNTCLVAVLKSGWLRLQSAHNLVCLLVAQWITLMWYHAVYFVMEKIWTKIKVYIFAQKRGFCLSSLIAWGGSLGPVWPGEMITASKTCFNIHTGT